MGSTPCLVALLAMALVAGCMGAPLKYAQEDVGHDIHSVAVFPFHNTTRAPDAGAIVTGAFIAGLVKEGRYLVEFPGNIRSMLVKERIVVRTGMDCATIALMGRRLGVDGVVLGEVEEFVGAETARRGVVPVVAFNTRLLDARDGRIVFIAQNRRTGDDYETVLRIGKITSAGALARKAVDEVVSAMP
ncbi:MAG: hypothetical protein AB7E47_00670 [Desulfovibrionaceae bacterium]